MRTRRLTYIVFVVLLTVCYTIMLPLLTVFHSHEGGAASFIVSGPSISESQSPYRELNAQCDVCFRLSSLPGYFGVDFLLSTTIQAEPTFSDGSVGRLLSQHHFETSGRSPPLCAPVV